MRCALRLMPTRTATIGFIGPRGGSRRLSTRSMSFAGSLHPTTRLSMRKPAKTGSILALTDFLKCVNLAFYIGTLSCESGQNRRCPADSELPMHR